MSDTKRERHIQIPESLYRSMSTAIRVAEEDIRGQDRTLKDETIEALRAARSSHLDWLEAKTFKGMKGP